MASRNKFSKALKHLKDKSIDEKLEMLEAAPTNNTSGIFVQEPGTFDTEETPADIDSPLNLDQDGDGAEGYTGNDTTGLFETDGTIRAIEPPGDTSYVLGPMISMFYAWASATQIGYVRQSDRKMVNLGRISGSLATWDGESGFTSYGQLTLEQAVWFQGQSRQDYRAFYPGPPSNPPDEYGRYIGSIVNTSKSSTPGSRQVFVPGTNTTFDPSDNLSLQLLDPKTANLLLNALQIGLDIAAVAAILFPEPGSSAAGFARLATRLRYIGKLRLRRGALNPFGQRAVRSGAAGRKRVSVYSGRSGYGKMINDPNKIVYGSTNRNVAGSYARGNQALKGSGTAPKGGTVYRGELPQRYIDKYGSRNVFGQSQVKIGKSAADRAFKRAVEYFESQGIVLSEKIILESIDAPSVNTNTNNAIDSFASNVDASPEEMISKSEDAAQRAEDLGVKVDFDKIDAEAEAEAKRSVNQVKLRLGDPSRMNDDQLFNAADLIYEADENWYWENHDRLYNTFVDVEKLQELHEDYVEQNEKFWSREYWYELVPEYKTAWEVCEYLWDNKVKNVSWVKGTSGYFSAYVYGEPASSEDYQQIYDWVDAFDERQRLQDVAIQKMYPIREKYIEDYTDSVNALYRNYYIALIEAWNVSVQFADLVQTLDSDPYSIENIPRGNATYDAASELGMLGISAAASFAFVKAVGASTAAKITSVLRKAEGIAKWYNKGRKPGEGKMSWRDLLVNDYKQMGKFVKKDSRWKDPKNLTDADFEGGPIPTNLDQLGQFVQGKGGLTWSFSRGMGTAPTPMGRQILERPFRALINLFQSYDPQGNLLSEETDDSLESSIDAALKETESLEDLKKVMDTFMKIMKIEKNKKEKNNVESYKPKFLKNRNKKSTGVSLTETKNRKRILRDIKKPVQVKEMPKSFKVKPTGRLHKNKSVGDDMMKIPNTPTQYKPLTNIWRQKDYASNVRASQEKKNEVLELLGAAEHHWTYLTEERRKKKQEEVNERLSISFDLEMQELYEKHKVNEVKITKAMSVYKKEPGLKPELPQEPPPQIDSKTGMHPKVGKHYKHNKLDPQSAEFMPLTGNPEIDANIEKARNKKERDRKLKILLGKSTSTAKKKKKALKEGMTSSGMFLERLPAVGNVNLGAAMPNISLSGTGSFSGYNAVTRSSTSSYAKFDTMVVSITTTSSDWVISPGEFISDLASGAAGSFTVVIPRSYSSLYFSAKEDGTFSASVQYQRRAPVNVFVGLNDPEANAFIRDGQADNLSPSQRRKKVEDMLKASDSYMQAKIGDVTPKTATEIADYKPQQSFMDIQVGDQRITKVNNRTVTDTTRGIKDGKMDGRPTYTDNQGNLRISQPKPEPKATITRTTTTNTTDRTTTNNRTSITNVPTTSTFTPTTDISSYEDREGYKTGIPAVDYSADIAASIRSNTPVNIPQKNIPKDQIKKLINAIDPNTIGEYGIPVNSTPQPYSDDNFYELPNGEVRKHTASSRAKYPNNTSSLSSGNTGFMGKGNPLGAAGQAQAQFVVPKDGSEPYYQYTDHAYVNSAQMGGGEIPDPIKTLGSIGVHAASGHGKKLSPLDSPYHQTGGVLDTTTPNTGKMKNYPSNIRGDVRKQIKVPLSQMPPKVQDSVNKQIKLGSVKESVEKIKQKRRLKSPKDLTDKIPGYYDGKPAPLGFPIVEPPKMKDGMHPDLVDGKKVAKRFNRLDPISAKAMPPTGNPHIDKKVKAAAKKPK